MACIKITHGGKTKYFSKERLQAVFGKPFGDEVRWMQWTLTKFRPTWMDKYGDDEPIGEIVGELLHVGKGKTK